MQEDWYKNLVCPGCHGALCTENGGLKCRSCNAFFPIASGIPCFTKGQSAWQFSLSDSSMRLIEMARENGWKASLSKINKEKADWIEGAGRFPLSLLSWPKGRVLDAGCGWGGLSFWLSSEFSQVYALDSQLDGLQFIDVRSTQEGVNNIFPVQGNLLSLPFRDSFFDLVLLNGVLEWVGTFSSAHSATELQEMALRETARVLRPNGVLYLAIENRFGLQYFMGYREEHTALRFISLLPRGIANRYHKHRRGKDFRALTYSRRALTGMLRKGGFSSTKWFSVFPSYRNCRYAASLEGTGALAFFFKNVLSHRFSLPAKIARIGLRAVSRSRVFLELLSFLSPSWIVFASQKGQPQLAIQSKERLLLLGNHGDHVPAITVNDRRASIFAIEKFSGRLKEKYTIPNGELAKKKIEMSQLSIEQMRKLRPSLRNNLPKVAIYMTKIGAVEFTKAVSGLPLNPADPKDVFPFVDVLVDLNMISINEDSMKEIPKYFDVRDRLLGLARHHRLGGEIESLLGKAQIIHGDLIKTNVLIHGNNPRVPILIDFEHAKVGPAVLNWYDFLLRNFLIYGVRYPIQTSVILKRCRKLPGNEKASVMMNKLTKRFLQACDVPLSLHGRLMALYMSYLCQDPIVGDPETIITYLSSNK